MKNKPVRRYSLKSVLLKDNVLKMQRAKCAFWRFRPKFSLLRDFVDVFYNVSRKQIRKK